MTGLALGGPVRYTWGFLLGGRSTVGHGALDAVIGVRIPASQPIRPTRSKSLSRSELREFDFNRSYAESCAPDS